MRCKAVASLSLSLLPAVALLILSTSLVSFAAAPDRIAGSIQSGRTVRLAKSLHRRAQAQYDQGPIDSAAQFSYVTVVISPSASQQEDLEQLLAQQQNPQSSNYHKWLTPQEFGERFGLSQNDLSKVTTWLQKQGLEIVSVAAGRNSVTVSGNASAVQRAFGTQIHTYNIEGKEHFANSTPVTIPAALNGIITGVIGLHSFGLHPTYQGPGRGAVRSAHNTYY